MNTSAILALVLSALVAAVSSGASSGMSGWNNDRGTQYHIQTDEGPERYFRYQTQSGQYRKEKRLQDGSVVGSYGWVGADGILRLRDYVADNAGYRVVRTKSVFVGRDEPIDKAIAKSKGVPSQGGTGLDTSVVPATATVAVVNATTPAPAPPPVYTTPPPAPQYTQPSAYGGNVLYQNLGGSLPSNSLQEPYRRRPALYSSVPVQQAADRNYYDDNNNALAYQQQQQQQQQFPLYDGISATHNGFRYYLPRHYHEQENLPGDRTAGSFGYIDPFGIRRVIYYNTAPGSGFVHRKNNRYVGFDATPYDPRF